MRSVRTVRTGSDDRSWFGRPQAIRKGGRECRQQKGDDASKTLDSLQRHHPLETSRVAVSALHELPKKRGVPPPLSSTHCPFTEGNGSKMTEEIPTGRRHYDQTTTGVSNPRKSRGPTLCSVRRIHPFTDDAFLCSPRYIPAAISRNAHK